MIGGTSIHYSTLITCSNGARRSLVHSEELYNIDGLIIDPNEIVMEAGRLDDDVEAVCIS